MTIPSVRHESTDNADVPRLERTEVAPDEAALWDFFTTNIAPRLPPRPVIVALAWGPGGVLQTLRERLPQATLYGDDVTPTRRALGGPLPGLGARPTLTGDPGPRLPLPIITGTVHLVSLTAIISRVDDPVSLLAEAHRLLAPTGLLWLQDAICRLAPDALRGPQVRRGEDATRSAPLSSVTDWSELLHAAAFALLRRGQASPTQQMLVALPTGS